MRRIAPYEHEEQQALVEWAQLNPAIGPYLISIPNEGKRSPMMGKRMRKMGLTRGVSDLLLAIPTSLHHGLFIELKRREKWVVTAQQLDFQKRMRDVGYEATICYGWDEARNAILNYLKAGQ